MTAPATVLVLDVGKTNAKVALVDGATLAEIDVMTRRTACCRGHPIRTSTPRRCGPFFLDGVREPQARHRVEAIAVTTHGATGALVDAAGGLALPVLDYEYRRAGRVHRRV